MQTHRRVFLELEIVSALVTPHRDVTTPLGVGRRKAKIQIYLLRGGRLHALRRAPERKTGRSCFLTIRPDRLRLAGSLFESGKEHLSAIGKLLSWCRKQRSSEALAGESVEE